MENTQTQIHPAFHIRSRRHSGLRKSKLGEIKGLSLRARRVSSRKMPGPSRNKYI